MVDLVAITLGEKVDIWEGQKNKSCSFSPAAAVPTLSKTDLD